MKRSTRNVVLSKAMKYVDEETRKEYRNKRIQSLECDNYNDNDNNNSNDDDLYVEEEDEQVNKKKRRVNNKSNKNITQSKWASRPIKSLERILMDNGIYYDNNLTANKSDSNGINTDSNNVDYYSVAASKSVLPPRQCFCSVCGHIGNYNCTRCGSKFCSIKCNDNHKETRCMKFSM